MSGAGLVGISATIGAWTKNEVLLFFAILLITMRWTKQPVSKVLMGAACILTLLAIFKSRPSKLSGQKRQCCATSETDRSIALRAGRGRIRLPINTLRRPAPQSPRSAPCGTTPAETHDEAWR
jgi:hypothetical protein